MKKKYAKDVYALLCLLCCVGAVFFWLYKVLPLYKGYVRTQIYLLVPLILILVGNIVLLHKILVDGKYKYERLFFGISMIWGCIFALIIPLAVGADGNSHLGTSYAMANELLGYKENDYVYMNESGEKEFEFGTFVRLEELQQRELRQVNTQSYIIASESGWFHAQDDGKLYLREDGSYWDWGGRIRYRYPFSALGICLGRLLGMGQVGIIYIAKLFNIIAFSIIGYICVRLVPIGKAQMVSIAMIPMVVETYSSLHYDNILIELIMLFVSLCLYFAYREEDMRVRDILVLLVILAMMLPMKYIFTLNALMVLVIPVKKYKTILKSPPKLIGLLSSIIVIGGIGICKYGRGILAYLKTPGGIDNTYNVRYMLSHVADVLEIFVKSFAPSHILKEINHMMGGWIGHLQFYLNEWLLYAILIIVIVGICMSRGEKLNKRNRRIAILTVMVVFILAWGMLLGRVSVEAPKTGLFMFGRYLMAIFLMVPVLFGSDEKESGKMMYVYGIQSILLTGVVCNILYEVISNYNIMQ